LCQSNIYAIWTEIADLKKKIFLRTWSFLRFFIVYVGYVYVHGAAYVHIAAPFFNSDLNWRVGTKIMFAMGVLFNKGERHVSVVILI
jgi:hypothetical protein